MFLNDCIELNWVEWNQLCSALETLDIMADLVISSFFRAFSHVHTKSQRPGQETKTLVNRNWIAQDIVDLLYILLLFYDAYFGIAESSNPMENDFPYTNQII